MSYFDPSAERARALRGAMDQALWDSARDILAEWDAGTLPDMAVGDAVGGEGPTCLFDYAALFDLDLHLRDAARASPEIAARATAHLRRRLAGEIPLTVEAAPPRIANFDTVHFRAEELSQMSRWWDTEPANRMAMIAASTEEYERCRAAALTAMAHLRVAAPDMHGEVETLIRDVVLAKPDGINNRINYSGASSFGLWGAITINAETQCDWIQLYRQIVHETGHNLLFAIARDAPLVRADSSIRRRSPIRADARPLDGIFHAAYVSAREAAALEALLQRHDREGGLSEEDAAIVADTLELSVLAFWDAVETLRGDDQGPTAFGHAVLADCETYMSANFALEPL